MSEKSNAGQQNNRFVLTLRKHHQLFTVIGAVIIFFTFVLKEGLRENLKDLVDEIKTAEIEFSAQLRNAQTLAELSQIEDEIRLIQMKEFAKKLNAEDFIREADQSANRLRAVWIGLQNVAQLSKRMNKSKQEHEPKEITDLRAELQACLEKYEEVKKTGSTLVVRPQCPHRDFIKKSPQVSYLGRNDRS